jgi:prepilin peptidase CpaA
MGEIGKMTLLTFLTLAVVSDFAQMRIGNRLIVSGLFWGLVLRIMGDGSAGAVIFLLHIAIPVVLLYGLFQIRALGAGDIKLLSMAGAYLSVRQLLYMMGMSFLCAAILGGCKLLYREAHQSRAGHRTLLHFSLPILIAYLLVVWGWQIE